VGICSFKIAGENQREKILVKEITVVALGLGAE
jgi:hypothetical protein